MMQIARMSKNGGNTQEPCNWQTVVYHKIDPKFGRNNPTIKSSRNSPRKCLSQYSKVLQNPKIQNYPTRQCECSEIPFTGLTLNYQFNFNFINLFQSKKKNKLNYSIIRLPIRLNYQTTNQIFLPVISGFHSWTMPPRQSLAIIRRFRCAQLFF